MIFRSALAVGSSFLLALAPLAAQSQSVNRTWPIGVSAATAPRTVAAIGSRHPLATQQGTTPLLGTMIDAGGGTNGTWIADPGPTSGFSSAPASFSNAVDVSQVAQPAPSGVYQTYRWGPSFNYSIGNLAPNAAYTVRLDFVEGYYNAAGTRIFNVGVNGAQVLSNFDIWTAAGGKSRAISRSYRALARADGTLVISFDAIKDNAVVSAISVSPAVLSIRAGGPATGAWIADPGATGNSSTNGAPSSTVDLSRVAQPAPAAVYKSYRWGTSFSYLIGNLVPYAQSTVRLHFDESYYSGENARIFNVFINGAPAIWNFDIVAAAGAPNRAVTRSFTTQVPASGTLSIAFNAVKDNAVISGIEVAPAGNLPATPVDNRTSQYDAFRTGWNPQEQVLNNQNVSASSFGLLSSTALDGGVDVQPLVATGEYIPTLGSSHDLVIAATENDSVYALDAASGAIVWQRSLLGAGERSIGNSDIGGCADIVGGNGITGTPVIDRVTDTLYVDAASFSSSTNTYSHRIHALSLSSGADLMSPAIVSGTQTRGTAVLTFDPQFARQRAGLALANGMLYVAFASYCDFSPHSNVGWMFAFNAATLAQSPSQDVFSTSYLNSIWQAGIAPAVDSYGALYAATGNGSYDGKYNLGMSLLKFASNLNILDSFTTRNQVAESQNDLDLSSAGVLLAPDQLSAGSYPHIAFQEGKTPVVRALNRDNLGGYAGGATGSENVLALGNLQSCDPTASVTCGSGGNNQSQAGGLWGGLAYYTGPNAQQYLVAADSASGVHSFAIQTSPTVKLALAAQSSVSLPNEGGATSIVSSNGNAAGSAIVWIANRNTPTFQLQAYDAATMSLLYSGNAGYWNSPSASSLAQIAQANGHVYVGTHVYDSNGNVTGGLMNTFGLLNASTSTLPRSRAASSTGGHFAALRLAGAVVYGPGSRMTAHVERSLTVRATPQAIPAAHSLYGVLRTVNHNTLVIQLRNGRFINVDAASATARGFVAEDLRVGKTCLVTGNINPVTHAFTAVSVMHLRRATSNLPADK